MKQSDEHEKESNGRRKHVQQTDKDAARERSMRCDDDSVLDFQEKKKGIT